MGLFGTAHGLGEQKDTKNVSHISCNFETWHSYTLPKEDSKNILIMWNSLSVLLALAFFQQKSENFAILRNADIDCIFIHNF